MYKGNIRSFRRLLRTGWQIFDARLFDGRYLSLLSETYVVCIRAKPVFVHKNQISNRTCHVLGLRFYRLHPVE